MPELLAQLYRGDPAKRDVAIAELWSRLCHQETVYEESAMSALALFKAAREAPLSASERDQVLALVAAIGRGEDTCWEGYTPWAVVQECAAAVAALVPELVEWARSGNAEARRWAVVLATYFPAEFGALGQDPAEFLTARDQELTKLVSLLVSGVEPEPSLIAAVAAGDEDTLDWLQDVRADVSLMRQGRQVVWNMAENGLL